MKITEIMEIDYSIIIPFILIIIAILILLIKKNKKDEQKFIEEMNKDIGDSENHPIDKI